MLYLNRSTKKFHRFGMQKETDSIPIGILYFFSYHSNILCNTGVPNSWKLSTSAILMCKLELYRGILYIMFCILSTFKTNHLQGYMVASYWFSSSSFDGFGRPSIDLICAKTSSETKNVTFTIECRQSIIFTFDKFPSKHRRCLVFEKVSR